ncbi:MAG TPA: zinc ribbon domain-containing protein [Pyrinomonadaceae bacterium]|jgi:hypothetical protein
MYCQTCGAETQPGLNYCNRCGSPVSAATAHEVVVPVDLTSPVRWVSATIGLSFLIGLTIIFITIAQLAASGFQRDGVMAIACISLIMLGVVEISLIRLLARVLGVDREGGPPRQLKRKRGKEIAAPQPQYIQPAANYAAPPTSVTEHTTRTFSPAFREPRT